MDKNLELSDAGLIKQRTGLVFSGIVTAIDGTTGVTVAGLSGFGNDFFASSSYADWEMYHLWDAGGAGAAPQGLMTAVSDYVSATGAFTITAFTSGTAAVGDKVMLIHPVLAWLGTKADAAATGAVNSSTFLSAYIKQILNELLGTDGGWTNLSGAAVASLDEAVQALAKVLAIDGANTLSVTMDGSARTTIEAIALALSDIFTASGAAFTVPVDGSARTDLAALLTNLAIITGARADAIPAMNAAPGTIALVPLIKAVMERVGATPNDSDDSILTILGQLDDAAATGATSGAEALVEMIRQIVTNTYKLAEVADGTGVFPVSVANDSLFAKILDSGDPANATNFSNATDSLRAIRAAIDAIGTPVEATDKGVSQTLEVAVTSAADAAGDTLLATIASGSVVITKIVVFAVTGQTANMTSAPVKGGAAKVLTFLAAADIVQADVDAADKQVSWSGEMRLNTGDTIVMEHNGTGPAALDLVVAFTFHASSADGATMS